MIKDLYKLEELGEESGKEEAARDFPDLPVAREMSVEEWSKMRRELTWYGRGRAQGRYKLRGKAARIFAQSWVLGYLVDCDLYWREGMLEFERRGREC